MRNESGQVLIAGIMIMLILLLCILFMFDIHNVIRAKFKLETAQESAALAGAVWQKESLNLIGEINLIKVASALMKADSNWQTTASYAEAETTEEKLEILKDRFAILSEMQTRISFVGPIVGLAAAQQAAKANGLNGKSSLKGYLDFLSSDTQRYPEGSIRNYNWKTPYIELLQEISDNNLAVFPNVRSAKSPIVSPNALAAMALYNMIQLHKSQVYGKSNVTEQSAWLSPLYNFVKNYKQTDFDKMWWNVDYSSAVFPQESEIFTLGLKYAPVIGNGMETAVYPQYVEQLRKLADGRALWGNADNLPEINLCRYDQFWYPEYYRENINTSCFDYDEEHYQFWFEKGVLRKNVKNAYRYEGPAAYVEGAVSVDSVAGFNFRNSARGKANFAPSDKDMTSGRSGKMNMRSKITTWLGSTRNHSSGSMSQTATESRPGVIAKTLGSLPGDLPPIEVPVVLPVFDKVSLMPTYMPFPSGFAVLKTGDASDLDYFLQWLSSLQSNPLYSGKCMRDIDVNPERGAALAEALRILEKGPEFRYFAWNPNWDKSRLDAKCAANPEFLYNNTSYFYQYPDYPAGAGYLQQPQVFTIYNENDMLSEKQRGSVVETAEVSGGGTARRVFLEGSRSSYYVIDSKNHVITNDETDPTRFYYSLGGSGTGSGYSGRGSRSDTQRGVTRF